MANLIARLSEGKREREGTGGEAPQLNIQDNDQGPWNAKSGTKASAWTQN